MYFSLNVENMSCFKVKFAKARYYFNKICQYNLEKEDVFSLSYRVSVRRKRC